MKKSDEVKDKIIEYAKKVVKYPKGSNGYDPADMMNLQFYVDYLEKLGL